MPRLQFVSLAALLLCLTGAPHAETRPADAKLDALIQRSGLEDQLVHFETAMQRGITQMHASEPSLRPEDLRRMRAAVADAYAPDRLRVALRTELAKSISNRELAATVRIETAVGIQEGFASTGPDVARSMAATMRKGLESERAQMAASLHEQSFVAFALVYAEASDADLKALLGFARSPAGMRYYAVSSRAFANTLGQAARRAGSALTLPAAPADI